MNKNIKTTSLRFGGLACVFFCLLSGMAAQGDWVYYDINEAIPDNDETGIQDTRNVTGFSNAIASLEVSIRISAAAADYAYNGDFFVTLQHESGFAVLLNRVGRTASVPLGYDNNGFDIVFSLAANDAHLYQNFTPTYDGSGRLVGNWGVDGRDVDPDAVLDTDARTATLSSFTGLNPNGNWTLFVADMNGNGNGTLEQWGMDVTVIPEPITAGLLLIGAAGLWLKRRSALPRLISF